MKLLDLLEEYKVRTHPKETTERLFKLAVRQFSLTLLRHAEVEDLTEERMAQHIVRRQAKGTAAGTIAGEQRKLYALWRFACKQGYIKVWASIYLTHRTALNK